MTRTLARAGDVVFGCVFFAVGMTLVVILGSAALEVARLRLRPPIVHRVVRTDIVPADLGRPGFDLVIRFQAPGREEVERAELHGTDYRDLARVQRTLPAGAPLIGRRWPPDAPARLDVCEGGWGRLVLFPAFMLIPATFACIGSAVAWGGMMGRKRNGGRTGESPRWTLLAGGVVFLLVGLAVVAAMLVVPTWHWVRSRSWAPATATVEMSRSIITRASKGGRSHHPAVLYRYEWDGRVHKSSRISAGAGRGGEAWTTMFVGSHPVGSATTCWVNPSDPTEAVLERSLSWWMVLGVPFCVFPVLGVTLWRAGWKGTMHPRTRHAPGRASREESSPLPESG